MKTGMIKVKVVGLTMLLGALGAHAQVTGTYQVHVDVQNTFGGEKNNIGTALAGLTCTASTNVAYRERHKDYRGQYQEITKQAAGNFGTSILRNPSLDMRFDADMSAASNAEVSILESCYFDPTLANAGVDAINKILKNKRGGMPHAQPDFFTMSWSCPITQPLPRVPRVKQVTDCQPNNNSFPFTMQQAMINILKDKKIRTSIELTDKKEVFAKNFCGDNRQDRVVFHLAGGVGGHLTEHRFVFDVEVKNETTGEKHAFSIDTRDGSHNSGTLNDDIAYCGSPGKRDRVTVTVKARTRHHLFKDRYYFGRDGSESVSFDLAASGGDQSKDITLYRNTAFGHTTQKYDSNIEVTLMDPAAGTSVHTGSVGSLAQTESH